MLPILGSAVGAAYHIVSALALVLSPLPWGLAAAAAIVVFTIGVRCLLLPLSYHALRGQAAQARLGGQVQALRQRYARQPDQLQRELTALYQREGRGLAAGCLPLLLQLPFLSVMYTLFRSATIGGHSNGLLGHDLLGTPLGSHWLSSAGLFSAHGAVFPGLFALLAAAVWLGVRAARRLAPAQSAEPAKPGGTMSVLTRVLPYSTLVIAAIMPLAAGLYLLTTTAWGAAERALLGRRALPPVPLVQPGGPQGSAGAGRRDHVRHDERSTGGGHPCTSRQSRTSPARTPRSPT